MKPSGRPSWKIRRRVVALTLLFCGGATVWLLGWGEDTELNRTIANGLILLAGGVIGSYVFGAAWDDMNVMKNFGERAYVDPYALPYGGAYGAPQAAGGGDGLD